MEEIEDNTDIFCQDGVLLKQAAAMYMPFIHTIGTVYITQSLNANLRRYIEWKPNDVTVDSEVQDQEWAVVNTVQKRIRTLSGNLPADYTSRLKSLKLKFEEIKSFKVSNKYRTLMFNDGKGELLCTFSFQHGDCQMLVGTLKQLFKTAPSKRDRHLFIVYDSDSPEVQQLGKSFAELNVGGDSHPFIWNMVKNIRERPYETTYGAFAKVADYVFRSSDHLELEDQEREDLSRSLTQFETASSHSQGEYEVIAKEPELPPRKDFPRLKPLSEELWKANLDCHGRIEDVESIKKLIFRGGVSPSIRRQVWKFLLDYYPWDSTAAEQRKLREEKNQEYFNMKMQWKFMTKTQEENFSDFRDRKSLIEKDVNRTDRNLDFFAGDNNANLQMLYDVLMTYVMYNFDLGYVQGMSDLLSPILMLFQNESDAFWCFVGFMNKVISNFDIDQAGMKEQLSNLRTLIAFVNPTLAAYLEAHDSGNMLFCFRWLLVWFKRELSLEDVMRFWEVLWTGHPCPNFHLLVCVAILENEMHTLIDNSYGFNEILKHVNELTGKLDMALMLNYAEGIFYQITESERLTDNVRLILGLPIEGASNLSSSSHERSSFDSPESSCSQPRCSVDNVRISPDDVVYERGLNNSFL